MLKTVLYCTWQIIVCYRKKRLVAAKIGADEPKCCILAWSFPLSRKSSLFSQWSWFVRNQLSQQVHTRRYYSCSHISSTASTIRISFFYFLFFRSTLISDRINPRLQVLPVPLAKSKMHSGYQLNKAAVLLPFHFAIQLTAVLKRLYIVWCLYLPSLLFWAEVQKTGSLSIRKLCSQLSIVGLYWRPTSSSVGLYCRLCSQSVCNSDISVVSARRA